MLETGYAPEAFGEGLIIPIPKGANQTSCANIEDFRGITISPVISKVFEHCLLKLFQSFLETDAGQFGFKKDKGCRDAVYAVNEIVNYFSMNASTVNLCTVDLSKAFDKLDHNVLFLKLIKKKTPICLIKILHNWYCKCTCVVRYGSCLSRMFPMKQGIRQGGVLSPILFAYYVDDVLIKLNCKYGCNIFGISCGAIMYADDIILLSLSFDHLQKLIVICNDEFKEIGLTINVKKCAVMRVGERFKRNCDDILLNENTIPLVDELKYLGVTLFHGNYLRVNIHGNKVKFFRSLNSIYAKLGNSANAETLVHLMKSNCLSALVYSLESVKLTKTNIDKLQFCLNRSFVKIFHVSDTESIEYCQYVMKQLPIEMLVDFRRFKFYRKLAASKCLFLRFIYQTLSMQAVEQLNCKYGVSCDASINLTFKHIWRKFECKVQM